MHLWVLFIYYMLILWSACLSFITFGCFYFCKYCTYRIIPGVLTRILLNPYTWSLLTLDQVLFNSPNNALYCLGQKPYKHFITFIPRYVMVFMLLQMTSLILSSIYCQYVNMTSFVIGQLSKEPVNFTYQYTLQILLDFLHMQSSYLRIMSLGFFPSNHYAFLYCILSFLFKSKIPTG